MLGAGKEHISAVWFCERTGRVVRLERALPPALLPRLGMTGPPNKRQTTYIPQTSKNGPFRGQKYARLSEKSPYIVVGRAGSPFIVPPKMGLLGVPGDVSSKRSFGGPGMTQMGSLVIAQHLLP